MLLRLVLLLPICGVAAIGMLLAKVWDGQKTAYEQTWHEYRLPAKPAFLSESLAFAQAQETLWRLGYDPAAWSPIENPSRKQTSAPDGTPHVYLTRFRTNTGLICFSNPQDDRSTLTVSIHLQGDRLSCSVVKEK